ncbi:DUF2922 domain-containing protein [Enterococcus gilvus]|uniref:DUF2922 domain-containing protein n=1 Tax=Enterococcus gilvus TaxID=160453 RepID=UPI003D6B2C58
MMKLVAKFRNSEGKAQTWSLDDPNTKNSPAQVEGLLQRFTNLKLFKKDGVDLFTTVESAKYVETIESIIF